MHGQFVEHFKQNGNMRARVVPIYKRKGSRDDAQSHNCSLVNQLHIIGYSYMH